MHPIDLLTQEIKATEDHLQRLKAKLEQTQGAWREVQEIDQQIEALQARKAELLAGLGVPTLQTPPQELAELPVATHPAQIFQGPVELDGPTEEELKDLLDDDPVTPAQTPAKAPVKPVLVTHLTDGHVTKKKPHNPSLPLTTIDTLPPPPRQSVVNYMTAKNAKVSLTLSGEIRKQLGPKGDGDNSIEDFDDGEVQGACDTAKDYALLAAEHGYQGLVTVVAQLPGPSNAVIVWQYNGNK